MPHLFSMVFFAALAGVVWPYVRRLKRLHFALIALVAFIGLAITVPKPTQAEIAAREATAEVAAKNEKVAAERAAAAAVSLEVNKSHDKIVAKAAPAVEVKPNYTRADFQKIFERVGAGTFAKLNAIEPGAAYAAAESRDCDRVLSASVSDTSSRNTAIWFVDCENDNRFMIRQSEAEAALDRFANKRLARSDLMAACTLDTISLCKASPVQRAAKKREVEFVSGCDMLLEQALTSPSSLSIRGMWNAEFGTGDIVTYRRSFDSQNAFGATIRSRYRCDVNATSGNIQRFQVEGPTGVQRLI